MNATNSYHHGINFIGDIGGALGLSHSALVTLRTLEQQSVPINFKPINYDVERVPNAPRLRKATKDYYPISLLYHNIHAMDSIDSTAFTTLTGNQYTIAYWYWEMMSLPATWQHQIERVNEIWVASTFVQETMLKQTTNPVHLLPHAISMEPSLGTSRQQFQLPVDRYIFHFSFSARSNFARKNPLAVIESFKQAFGSSKAVDSPLLVIKAQNILDFPDLHHRLAKAVEQVGGILITESYSRQQVADLLSCIDCYVSLHRAEGFGMALAESMFLGKPVIGTAYSGNLDFMNEGNSFLVDYNLCPIIAEDHSGQEDSIHLYQAGELWADPNIDTAAEFMTQLAENPQLGIERGNIAAKQITERYSYKRTGEDFVRRLTDIHQQTDLEQYQQWNDIQHKQRYFNSTKGSGLTPKAFPEVALCLSSVQNSSELTKHIVTLLPDFHHFVDVVVFRDERISVTSEPHFFPLSMLPKQHAQKPFDIVVFILDDVFQEESLPIKWKDFFQHHQTSKKNYIALTSTTDLNSKAMYLHGGTLSSRDFINAIRQIADEQTIQATLKNKLPHHNFRYNFTQHYSDHGWREHEQSPDGTSYQWSISTNATLHCFLDDTKNYEAHFIALAINHQSNIRDLALYVNDIEVPLQSLRIGGWWHFSANISNHVLQSNSRNTKFTFNVPTLFYPHEDNNEGLGVCFISFQAHVTESVKDEGSISPSVVLPPEDKLGLLERIPFIRLIAQSLRKRRLASTQVLIKQIEELKQSVASLEARQNNYPDRYDTPLALQALNDSLQEAREISSQLYAYKKNINLVTNQQITRIDILKREIDDDKTAHESTIRHNTEALEALRFETQQTYFNREQLQSYLTTRPELPDFTPIPDWDTLFIKQIDDSLAANVKAPKIREQLASAHQTIFRGSKSLIQARQERYVPYLGLRSLPSNLPILDVGCGRGEFLSILREHGKQSIGIDTNPTQISELLSQGFDVHTQEVISYLQTLQNGTLAGITAFQVIEHLSHDMLIEFIELARDKLASGGFILLETINPHCLTAMQNFYSDLTHHQPIPPRILMMYLRFFMLENLQVFLSEPAPQPHFLHNDIFTQYQDYAVLGWKA